MARRRKQRSAVVADEFGMEARQDSSWTLPLTILGVTLLLSGGFLYYYFGPSLRELRGDTPDPSASTAPISMLIGETELVVPTNFTRFPRSRRDGRRQTVALYALLPGLTPFTTEDAEKFDSNQPDSAVLYFDISTHSSALSEEERLERVYKLNVTDPLGREGPFGLTAYDFKENTGYESEDLFVFNEDGRPPIVIRCFKETEIIPSPHCRRDMQIGDQLSLSYRYKRPWLAQWRSIDLSLQKLVQSFIVEPDEP